MMGLALVKMLALFNVSLPSVALPNVTLPKRDLVLCFVCMLVGTVRLPPSNPARGAMHAPVPCRVEPRAMHRSG